MPFVTVRTSAAMSREQELDLKSRIGQAVSFVPGKSEASLLLCFEPAVCICTGQKRRQP